jgi:hypothetical protein
MAGFMAHPLDVHTYGLTLLPVAQAIQHQNG